MKPLYPLVVFLLMGFATFGQNNASESVADRLLYAEQGLKVMFANPDMQSAFKSQYGIKPFEFKLKNRDFLSSFSVSVIDMYKNEMIDLDTLESYFFNQVALNATSLDLSSNPHEEVLGTPFQTKVAGGPCVNMDFEEGTLNGWEMYTGSVNTNPAEMVGATQIFTPGTQHTIVAPGADPVVGIPMTNPNGGTSSLRLGDGTGTGALAASVRQTFLVSLNNAIFTYSYAVVLEDPSGHTLGEKPFFKVNLYDQAGNIIPCGEYQVVASTGLDASWVSYAGGWYKNWTTVFAPLDTYIGQNVTIEFISGDCSQSGHYGYAYVDAECSPLELIPPGTVICDNEPATLTAPAGAASYSWSTGATTQSITTAVPGTYTCTIVPVTGAACSTTLTATVTGSVGSAISDFTAAPMSICAGQTVNFTDASTTTTGDPVSAWNWDFDDGATATTANATHVFGAGGSYDVSLSTNLNGCGDTIIQTILVEDGPTADFTVTTVCEGTSVQFTDASTVASGAITSWEWDFTNNGSVDNTQQNPTSVIGPAGSYTASLTVSTSLGCSSSTTMPVTIHPIPVADFDWTDVCEGLVMNFTDQSTITGGTITGFQWDFGDLIGSSTSQNSSYTYSAPNTYNVVLTVTSDQGCVDAITETVEMFSNPVAAFTFTDVCEGSPVHFEDNSNANGATFATYDWDFEDDGTIEFSGNSTDYSFAGTGSHDVHLYVTTTDGCSDDLVQTVDVFPSPTASFTGQNVCEGTVVNFTNTSSVSTGTITGYSWDFGNGVTSALQTPTQLYGIEGVYTVTLEVTSDNGCTNEVTAPVEIYPTPVAQFLLSDVCDGSLVNFTDFSTVSNQSTVNNITSWQWDFGTTPATTSSGQFASTTYTAPGTYTVTLDIETNHGCVNTTQNDVTVYPNPVIDFSSPNPDGCTQWCPDFVNNSSIASGTINSYLWNLGDGTAVTDETPIHCYTNNSLQTMTFTVSLTVTSDFGCTTSFTDFDMITVYPAPIAEFSFNPTDANIYDPTINFVNESSLNYFNQWNFAGLGMSEETDPTFVFPDADSGTYTVCLFVETINGCQDEICHDVYIEGVANLYIPNTFTPDNDGINDFFGPVLYGYSEDDFSFMVFDRWGLLIYESESLNGTWDGNFKGDKCQQDAYVWKISAKDKYTGDFTEKMGHVMLLR